MTLSTAQRFCDAAVDLKRTHPQASALEVLDLVFNEAPGAAAEIDARLDDAGSPLHPRSPFGQLIAEAFDHGMSPEDWMNMTGPKADPKLVTALDEIWRTYVLPRFASRYGVDIRLA